MKMSFAIGKADMFDVSAFSHKIAKNPLFWMGGGQVKSICAVII